MIGMMKQSYKGFSCTRGENVVRIIGFKC